MQSRMVGCTQAAQVFRGIRPTLCQRHPMMHQRCLSISSFCHAHLTQRLPCQLRSTYPAPCSSVVPLPVCRAAEEPVVLPVCFLPMRLAELSVCQIRAAGMLAWFQGFSRHTSHLQYPFRAIEKPSQVLPCKGFVVIFFFVDCPLQLVQYNNITPKTLMQPFQP